MIGEEEMDDMVERARALGTDYAVLSDLLRLMAEVRRLRVPVEAAARVNAARLRYKEAERGVVEQRVRLTEAETELETALENALAEQPAQAAQGQT